MTVGFIFAQIQITYLCNKHWQYCYLLTAFEFQEGKLLNILPELLLKSGKTNSGFVLVLYSSLGGGGTCPAPECSC